MEHSAPQIQEGGAMYDTDSINAAMGAQRLTNEKVAERAGVSAKTVSLIRNGFPNVTLPTLERIAGALDLKLVVKLEKKAA
jgi:transcriptional regulator with XRE-family HTH domain